MDVGLRSSTAPLVVAAAAAPLMGTGACRPGGGAAACGGWLCSLDLLRSRRPSGPSENLARGTSGLRTMTGESRRGTMRRGEGSWGSGEGGVGETSMGGGVEAAEDGGLLVALRGRGKESDEGVVGWLCGERTRKAAGLWPNADSPAIPPATPISCCCSGLLG